MSELREVGRFIQIKITRAFYCWLRRFPQMGIALLALLVLAISVYKERIEDQHG